LRSSGRYFEPRRLQATRSALGACRSRVDLQQGQLPDDRDQIGWPGCVEQLGADGDASGLLLGQPVHGPEATPTCRIGVIDSRAGGRRCRCPASTLSESDSRSVRRGAGQHDEVAVGIAEPELALVGVGVHVHITLDQGSDILHALNRSIKIRNLEPEKNAVTERNVTRRERPVVVLHVDVVQLQDEFPTADELLILLATVGALRLEDLRVNAWTPGRRGRR
jgi:hypothetical protein